MAQMINSTEFNSLVLESSKPVMVDFFATWCGPCKMLAPVIDEISFEISGKAEVYKLDIDDNEELCEKYGISAVPTLLFFNEGKCVDRIVGVGSKANIVSILEELIG